MAQIVSLRGGGYGIWVAGDRGEYWRIAGGETFRTHDDAREWLGAHDA